MWNKICNFFKNLFGMASQETKEKVEDKKETTEEPKAKETAEKAEVKKTAEETEAKETAEKAEVKKTAEKVKAKEPTAEKAKVKSENMNSADGQGHPCVGAHQNKKTENPSLSPQNKAKETSEKPKAKETIEKAKATEPTALQKLAEDLPTPLPRGYKKTSLHLMEIHPQRIEVIFEVSPKDQKLAFGGTLLLQICGHPSALLLELPLPSPYGTWGVDLPQDNLSVFAQLVAQTKQGEKIELFHSSVLQMGKTQVTHLPPRPVFHTRDLTGKRPILSQGESRRTEDSPQLDPGQMRFQTFLNTLPLFVESEMEEKQFLEALHLDEEQFLETFHLGRELLSFSPWGIYNKLED